MGLSPRQGGPNAGGPGLRLRKPLARFSAETHGRPAPRRLLAKVPSLDSRGCIRLRPIEQPEEAGD
jgi:hypothetical protein